MKIIFITLYFSLLCQTIFGNDIDSIKLLLKCETGDADTCFMLGQYMHHITLKEKKRRDFSLTMKYYEKACKLNNAKACLEIGHMYQKGIFVKEDIAKAIEYYKKSAKNGSAYGYFNIANIFHRGKNVKKDLYKAEKYYNLSCSMNKRTCNKLLTVKYMKIKPTRKEDYSTITSIDKLCNNGMRSIYCTAIGNIYEKHNEYKKAIKYYKMSCNNANASGCISLAKLYNTKGKYEDSTKYFKMGCSQGEHKACYELGLMYEKLQNNTNSKIYYQKACNLGYIKGCIKKQQNFGEK